MLRGIGEVHVLLDVGALISPETQTDRAVHPSYPLCQHGFGPGSEFGILSRKIYLTTLDVRSARKRKMCPKVSLELGASLFEK